MLLNCKRFGFWQYSQGCYDLNAALSRAFPSMENFHKLSGAAKLRHLFRMLKQSRTESYFISTQRAKESMFANCKKMLGGSWNTRVGYLFENCNNAKSRARFPCACYWVMWLKLTLELCSFIRSSLSVVLLLILWKTPGGKFHYIIGLVPAQMKSIHLNNGSSQSF